jgi:ectoine hydroxylase-related dioxygenase (phytanoyl-CoA dioxygenase family)
MKMPIEKLNKITDLGAYDSNKLDKNILKQYGIFVLRNAISMEVVKNYKKEYDKYKMSDTFDRNNQHLTEVRLSEENPLLNIINDDDFLRVGHILFPDGIGVYNIRIVKKDAQDLNPVFLHQDVGYQYGSFHRYSFFIPLSKCSIENGGLSFVPGSHNFGYLGDVGALKEALVPDDLTVITPTVDLGDIIIMNSYVWHRSGPNQNKTERVYYDIHLNSSADPASRIIIGGGLDEREYALDYDNNKIFDNSRLQRLEKFIKKYGAI